MKKIHGGTKNRVLGLCMLIAILFGSAVAKADVVLDWNVIAVNTRSRTARTHTPRHDTRQSYNSPYSNP